MKKITSIAIFVAVLVFLNGCAIHNRVSLQDQLTVTFINNTSIDLNVLVDGRVSLKLPSAMTDRLGFYSYMGHREITLSVQGLCPPSGVVYVLHDPRTINACQPGSIVGNRYRGQLWVHGDGTYRRAEAWQIDGVEPLTGGLSY